MKYEEYMMESVCSALDELVGGGTLTEEQADKVFELACEKYISEARALDKYVDKKADELQDKHGSLNKAMAEKLSKNPEGVSGLEALTYLGAENSTYRKAQKDKSNKSAVPKDYKKLISKDLKKEVNESQWKKASRKEMFSYPFRSYIRRNSDDLDYGEEELRKIHKKYFPGKNGKTVDMTPAKEKKAGKYMDMYNKKKAESK